MSCEYIDKSKEVSKSLLMLLGEVQAHQKSLIQVDLLIFWN